MTRRVLPLLAGCLALAGCATREPPPAPPPASAPAAPAPGPEPTVPAPQSYVAVSSSIDRLMIEAAKLAEIRARDPRLRHFAEQIRRDHFSISAQLSFAGRRLNQLPTGRLADNHQQRLAALAGSADFDSAYRAEMGRSLAAALEYHRRYAETGDSPTLRSVARYAAGLVAGNLARLRTLP